MRCYLEVLKECDGNSAPKFNNQTVVAGELYKKPKSSKLKEKLGYKKFKNFIQAEVRKLVETEVEGLTHSILRIIKK